MTTETTAKKTTTRKAKDPVVASCNCEDQIKVLESQVEVLVQYMRTFNTFLNQNMISNTIDSMAEAGLTEVLDTYPS
jgi:hypothetical protein